MGGGGGGGGGMLIDYFDDEVEDKMKLTVIVEKMDVSMNLIVIQVGVYLNMIYLYIQEAKDTDKSSGPDRQTKWT